MPTIDTYMKRWSAAKKLQDMGVSHINNPNFSKQIDKEIKSVNLYRHTHDDLLEFRKICAELKL